jgi:hypothetical protein
MLAFIKCHLTSFVRWDALRVLAERVGCWQEAAEVAGAIHRQPQLVRLALEDLVEERLVERRRGTHSPVYRLSLVDPTSRVVARLVDEAKHNQEVRRIIVARVIGASSHTRPSLQERCGHQTAERSSD